MKKILLITALFCISLSSNIFAQCTPDAAIVSAGVSGLFPTPADGIDTGITGAPYSQLFTVIVPTDTTVTLPAPIGTQTATINTSTVTGVAGLPAGLNYLCTPTSCIVDGGSNGCFVIEGIPTVSGTFTVTVSVLVNVTALGIPVDLPVQDILYVLEVTGPGGCTLGVTATATDETAVGLADGTATATASNGTLPYTYVWSDLQTTSTAVGLTPDSYSVVVTDAAGCIATITITVAGGPTGINTVNSTAFEVYPITPNPSSNGAEIRFTTPDYRDVSLTVHNMIGALVISKQIYSEKGLNLVELHDNELKPGVYVVTLSDGDSTSAKRMVVSE